MVNNLAVREAAHEPPQGRPATVERAWREPGRLRRAVDDLIGGVGQSWIWSSMAWQDIRQRYRGSLLGPFWLTLSMAIMIATLGVLYSTLFKQDINSYLPFLTLGILFWNFISALLTEGCSTFIGAEPIIRQVRMPFTVHVCRTLYRNLIVLAHNAVVYLAVLALFPVKIGVGVLLLLPGIAILVANGMWAAILLGMICARFRDVVPIVASLIQIIFFITPIIWTPATLGGHHLWLVEFNPFYAMIEIVRAPLLGQPVPMVLWAIALGVTLAGWVATFCFFVRFRSRIPFWV